MGSSCEQLLFLLCSKHMRGDLSQLPVRSIGWLPLHALTSLDHVMLFELCSVVTGVNTSVSSTARAIDREACP
jgi:hypothetical protein